MRKNIFLFLGFLLLLGAYSPAKSQAILVQNGGFEKGAFTGWNTWNTEAYVLPKDSTPQVVKSGNYGAYMQRALITQNITLPGPGQYEFGGYLRFFTNQISDNGGYGQLSIGNLFDANGYEYRDTALLKNISPWINAGGGFESNVEMSEWIYLSGIYNYTGSAGDVPLNITLFYNPGIQTTVMGADDIFVNPVPVPGTMLLFGSGLAGLVGYGRMRFRRFKK